MSNELTEVLRHRLNGHWIKFHPIGASAQIYCHKCKRIIVQGDRDQISEVFECALQHRQGEEKRP